MSTPIVFGLILAALGVVWLLRLLGFSDWLREMFGDKDRPE